MGWLDVYWGRIIAALPWKEKVQFFRCCGCNRTQAQAVSEHWHLSHRNLIENISFHSLSLSAADEMQKGPVRLLHEVAQFVVRAFGTDLGLLAEIEGRT